MSNPATKRRMLGRHADADQQRSADPGREPSAAGIASSASMRLSSQQLADDASPSRADRQPDGDLPLPLRAAREQQVGDVRARNQQHERPPTPARARGSDPGPRRACPARACSTRTPRSRLRLGMLALQALADHRHLRLRVFERSSGREPADDGEVAARRAGAAAPGRTPAAPRSRRRCGKSNAGGAIPMTW